AGQASVLVHVLANDYDPAGSAGDLSVVAVFAPHVQIVDGRTALRIPVGRYPRLVAYEISNPQGGTAVGTVHVPGLDEPAHLVASAGVVQVPHDGSATVDIDRYIADARGPVRLVSQNG